MYIRRPLLVRGHQAARRFLTVSMFLSLYCFKFSSFPCILHSLLVSSFLSKFYSCNASLFLCCYRAHRSTFSASLDPVLSAWAPPGYPSKINDFQTYSPDPQNQKKWVPGIQKATKKTCKSRLDIIQFTKYVKKWNLTKTTVFAMFSAHPTTDPGILFAPKPSKKHTSELTLKIDNLKPKKNKKIVKNRLPTGSLNPLKIIKIQPWSPNCPLWCS